MASIFSLPIEKHLPKGIDNCFLVIDKEPSLRRVPLSDVLDLIIEKAKESGLKIIYVRNEMNEKIFFIDKK